jgi:hypothetical protein
MYEKPMSRWAFFVRLFLSFHMKNDLQLFCSEKRSRRRSEKSLHATAPFSFVYLREHILCHANLCQQWRSFYVMLHLPELLCKFLLFTRNI